MNWLQSEVFEHENAFGMSRQGTPRKASITVSNFFIFPPTIVGVPSFQLQKIGWLFYNFSCKVIDEF